MAKLSRKTRKRMRSTTFAIPSERKYPIPDLAHARNALARVEQHGTPREKRLVKAAVRRRFPALAKRSAVLSRRKRRRTTRRTRR